MSEICPRCESEEGHLEWELIEVDGKYFCPWDLRRVYTMEEAEEFSDEQLKEIREEYVQCTRRASYKIIKTPRRKSEQK